MSAKRPLLDTAADQRLYVSDVSRERAERSALLCRHTLIVGGAGSGKSSLLYRIRARARESSTPLSVVRVDARLAADARELVELVALGAAEAGWIDGYTPSNAEDLFAVTNQIRRLRETRATGSIVLIDDPTPNQAVLLFGRMRDEIWQVPISVTAAVDPHVHESALSQPPADAFFDRVVRLEPFAPDVAAELLERRRRAGEAVQGLPSRPLQPRAILLDAEGSATRLRDDQQLQTDLTAAAREHGGRPGVMLFDEIWARGAVSASDQELQRRLGVSRVRLTELFGILERAGVLVSFRDEPNGRPGRPRTMYDISPSSESPTH